MTRKITLNNELKRILPRFLINFRKELLEYKVGTIKKCEMIMPELITFVILQFNTSKLSIDCINTITKLTPYLPVKIIIVDNLSNSEEKTTIKDYCLDKSNIVLIENSTNLGYAQGINIGYERAISDTKSQIVCVMNNDILFNDPLFIKRVIKRYKKNKFCILGPDIIVPNKPRLHQNPLRYSLRTKKEINKFIKWNESKLSLLTTNSLNPEKPPKAGGTIRKDPFIRKNNLVLHGSILVLSPIFLRHFNTALVPGTFFYGEEDLVALRTCSNGLSMIYDPSISVIHLAGGSSQKKNIIEYYHRRYTNNLLYAKLYNKMLIELE